MLKNLGHWKHHHSFLAGGATIGVFFAHNGWALLLAGFLGGVLVAWAFRAGGRIFDRVNRMLPDSSRQDPTVVSRHCEQCGEPIHHPSKASFCSVGCREYAAKQRRAQGFQAELADADEIPF